MAGSKQDCPLSRHIKEIRRRASQAEVGHEDAMCKSLPWVAAVWADADQDFLSANSLLVSTRSVRRLDRRDDRCLNRAVHMALSRRAAINLKFGTRRQLPNVYCKMR